VKKIVSVCVKRGGGKLFRGEDQSDENVKGRFRVRSKRRWTRRWIAHSLALYPSVFPSAAPSESHSFMAMS